jgi:quercetin dioxygenase-like cupin family protein
MTAKLIRVGVLVALGVLIGRATMAQSPPGPIAEQELLNNDSVRIVLVTYPPGADSDLHLNVGPEITIVQEGELALYAKDAGGTRPPDAHWLPDATAHLARNETGRPTRFRSILLKRALARRRSLPRAVNHRWAGEQAREHGPSRFLVAEAADLRGDGARPRVRRGRNAVWLAGQGCGSPRWTSPRSRCRWRDARGGAPGRGRLDRSGRVA